MFNYRTNISFKQKHIKKSCLVVVCNEANIVEKECVFKFPSIEKQLVW